MTERARANLDEQCEGSRKQQNDGSKAEAPKKACLNLQSGTDNNGSVPKPPPRMTQSREASIEEIPNEDDIISHHGSSNGCTRAMTQNANVGPESAEDQLNVLSMSCTDIISSQHIRETCEGVDITYLCILQANANNC